MKHLYLLAALFLGHMLHATAMAAPAAVYAAPVDTTQAVKIAKKADELLKGGQTMEAWDLYEEAGKMGLMSAQRKLMNHYAELGMMNNAYYWNEKLANSGDVQAQIDMGMAYLYGPEQTGQTMYEPDAAKAAEWFLKAYKKGNKAAAYFLGLIAIGQSNVDQGVKYLQESGEEIPYAYYLLGEMYYNGEGATEDHAKAFKFYKKAAERDVEESIITLSYLYMMGDGCARDYEMCIHWAAKGIKSENADISSQAEKIYARAKREKENERSVAAANTPASPPALSNWRGSQAATTPSFTVPDIIDTPANQSVTGHGVAVHSSNTGIVVSDLQFDDARTSSDENARNYAVIDEYPQFPGGDAALLQFLATHIRYPQIAQEQEIQGVVYLRFVVNEDGSVGDVIVDKGLQKDCDEEAIRVVKSFPRFKPAKQQGKPVKCWFSLPVRYALQ